MQSSGSCGFQEQQRILGLFELSQEFKQQHYLAGLLLTELSAALDVECEAYEQISLLLGLLLRNDGIFEGTHYEPHNLAPTLT